MLTLIHLNDWLVYFGRLQSHLNFNCCFVCLQLIPHDCSAIFSNIQFNDRKFNDCNEIFKLQNTEVGTCFTANGLYFYDFDLKKLPLRYRRGDMERRLTFDFLYDKLYTPYVSKVHDFWWKAHRISILTAVGSFKKLDTGSQSGGISKFQFKTSFQHRRLQCETWIQNSGE